MTKIKSINTMSNKEINESKEIVCKGFIASILEDKRIGNCSNNGISAYSKEVTIVSDDPALQIFETTARDELTRPLVVIVKRIIGGKPYIHAQPIDDPKGVGWMAGGSFIYSYDSRFGKLSEYPIPLHDRQETQEEYNHYD